VNGLAPLIGVAALLASCSVFGGGKTVVSSEAFPNTTIECQGEVALADAPCREWGHVLLAGFPEVADSTVRLILTDPGGNTRCDAEFFGGDGRLLAHEAVVCPSI
jgi:hypothetical protein